MRRNPDNRGFDIGHLVYLDAKHVSDLKILSQQLSKKRRIGPFKIHIYGYIDDFQFMISYWNVPYPVF